MGREGNVVGVTGDKQVEIGTTGMHKKLDMYLQVEPKLFGLIDYWCVLVCRRRKIHEWTHICVTLDGECVIMQYTLSPLSFSPLNTLAALDQPRHATHLIHP